MQLLILFIHVAAAVSIIALVLMQHGKGADAGAGFGAGASQTMFGSKGAVSFLVKITGLLAAIFFATSLTLGYLASREFKQVGAVKLPTQAPMTNQHPAKK